MQKQLIISIFDVLYCIVELFVIIISKASKYRPTYEVQSEGESCKLKIKFNGDFPDTFCPAGDLGRDVASESDSHHWSARVLNPNYHVIQNFGLRLDNFKTEMMKSISYFMIWIAWACFLFKQWFFICKPLNHFTNERSWYFSSLSNRILFPYR